MKKIVTSLVCPLIGALLMVSCLSNDDVEKSSEVALLSFGIKDLKTQYTFKKEDGTDSTYTVVLSGSTVGFTIDQTNRRVYNTDSIVYGTNVEDVLVNVKADGDVCYFKPNGEVGSMEDSIDFTSPVTFRVTSYDEKFYRDYKVSINVHQVDPKETTWNEFKETNIPCLNAQKAFVKGDSLYVIGIDADGVYYTASAALSDASDWTTTELEGIEGTGLSALLVDGFFYLKTDAGTYRSEDAVEWVVVADEAEPSTLPTDMEHVIALFRQPLITNPNITRTIVIATPEATDTCAQVWTQLSTEDKPIEIGSNGNNIYGCPNLENLVVIQYADKMYAFGGKSMGNRKEPLAAFGACYESRDNGITWKVNEEAFSLPKEFAGYETESFSTATDGEYVWVMWSSGSVWRGRWNEVK